MLNTVSLVGRITADPELKHTSNGNAVCSFTIAVQRDGRDQPTDFLDCVAWRQTAEFIGQYVRKGALLSVSGSIQTRTYQDREGKNRKVVEILAQRVNSLEKRERAEERPIEVTDADLMEDLPF